MNSHVPVISLAAPFKPEHNNVSITACREKYSGSVDELGRMVELYGKALPPLRPLWKIQKEPEHPWMDTWLLLCSNTGHTIQVWV